MIKFGIIGAGGIADRRTLPGMLLSRYARPYAVMELDGGFAEALRVKYGAEKAYTDWRQLILDPEVEAVYIATPVMLHAEQAIFAARHGKHILLEKPVALTAAEGENVVSVCESAGVKCAAGFMMRRHAAHMKMRELIEQGKLGQLVSARAQLTCWYPKIEGVWRQDRTKSGGGALMDMGIHCIDLLQYITGSRVREAKGFTDNRTFDYNADDSSDVLLKLENGAVAFVDSHFNIPDEAAFCRLELYGTRGSILAQGTIGQTEGGVVRVTLCGDKGYDASQNRAIEPTYTLDYTSLPYAGNLYAKEIDALCSAIINDTAPDVPLSEAVQVQKIIEELYK